jgi:hypothetical protein
MHRLVIIMCFALALGACGTASLFSSDVVTQTPPTVSRVEPTSGPPGTEVTIYGFGYSIDTPINIVIIGGSGSSATEYQILGNPTPTEIETLTATVPDDAELGESSVVVVVHQNTSNTDVMFDVTP